MGYYIKQIENNKYNHYKYNYLDHISAIIDIRDNYWTFAINLFTINDFSLPNNSLSGDLILPYQTISNLTFNLNSDQTKTKENVNHNQNYAHLYSGTFDVDISENEYFKQDLNNALINFDICLFIDPEAAQSAGKQISQDDLDSLMQETSEQRWSFNAYYTNTNIVNESCGVNNVTGFTLVTGDKCIPTSRVLDVTIPTLVDLNRPFNELVQISSLTSFQIISGTVKINYWLELDIQTKTLSKVLSIDHSLVKNISIAIDDYTIYDFSKNEVVFNPFGLLGFNIPKYAQGYYQIELLVSQEGVVSKLVIENQFNFKQNQIAPYIIVLNKTINSLDGFKEVKFYES